MAIIKLDESAMGLPLVYLLWSGVKRIPETHSLRCICTNKDQAEQRMNGKNLNEMEAWGDNDVEWWIEPRELDHLYGETCMESAREVLRKTKRTGD